MDRLKRGRDIKSSSNVKKNMMTRDVGVLCSDLVPVNDKCVMVGTTGIAALKAEYGDDFTNFEIIQDIGYSSESSTHLSGDDGSGVGGDRYYNIRVYSYNNSGTGISLKEELEKADSGKFHSLGSSLGSSSLDDSGLGTNDLLANGEGIRVNLAESFLDSPDGEGAEDGLYSPEEESDFLETVLDSCGNFGTSTKVDEGSEAELLHFSLSGLESDDASDSFHKRSSFTTSAQVFYKMISVDSDNDCRPNDNDRNDSTLVETNEVTLHDTSTSTSPTRNKVIPTSPASYQGRTASSSDSGRRHQQTITDQKLMEDRGTRTGKSQKLRTSTPIRNRQDDRTLSSSFRQQNLKRKRDSDMTDFTITWPGGGRTSSRVRSWLKRCAEFSGPNCGRKNLLNTDGRWSPDVDRLTLGPAVGADVSSCDASCECTSSSADEDNAFSSSSSFFGDDVASTMKRQDSCSAEGSIETVVRMRTLSGFTESEHVMLPPPPTPPCRDVAGRGSLYDYPNVRDHLQCIIGFSVPSINRVKASSETDVRPRALTKPSEEISNNLFCDRTKRCFPSVVEHSRSRLHSSLPTLLHRHSEYSTDDCRTSVHYSDVKTANTSVVQSSSSELGKRRKRRSRKSSSSNRSSKSTLLSSDAARHRSKTLTSSGSRRRRYSQKSDFFGDSERVLSDENASDGKLPPTVIPNDKELDVGLNLVLDDACERRDSSVLTSPVESDIVLTQLEEQSTVSDQVWDGYQEMPYLSEAYSEATVDEDAVRKLTEFGDDYVSAIGQPVTAGRPLLDPEDNGTKKENRRSPDRKVHPLSHRRSSLSNDSDSDSEDLHHLIDESGKALLFAKSTLKKRQSGHFLTSAEYAELLATCSTHLRCLQTICEHIDVDGRENIFSSGDLKELYYLIEEWEILKKSTDMYERAEDHMQQKFLKAQEDIDNLFNKMTELSSLTNLETKNFNSWEDLRNNMSKLQMVLSALQETKEQLLAVNLHVHRFTTEYGDEIKDCSLKDDVTELYRQWEDIYEQNGTHLTQLQTLSNRWEAYDEKFQNLRLKVKEAELASGDCDKNCFTLDEKAAESLRTELKELQYEAGYLENRLKGGPLWQTIDQELREMGDIIKKHVNAAPVSQSSLRHSSSVSVEDDSDDNFEDAIQQLDDDSGDDKSTNKGDSCRRKGPSRFWRIVRLAVPVQFAIVLLYCIACYMEPSCCDMLNNFNFSLTPQLRYFRGPPPV